MMRLAFLAVLLASIACGDDDSSSPDAGDGLDGGADASVDAGDDIDAAEGCTGSGDCPGQACYGPNDPFCGIGPRQECDGDDQCGKFMPVCHVILDACSADGYGSECGAPCEADSCGDGFTCTAGRCLPTACTGESDCPDSQRCDTSTIPTKGPVHAITAGCTTVACEGSVPCQEGTCVNGYCQDGPGMCSSPPP